LTEFPSFPGCGTPSVKLRRKLRRSGLKPWHKFTRGEVCFPPNAGLNSRESQTKKNSGQE
jgi:hypothetical protein